MTRLRNRIPLLLVFAALAALAALVGCSGAPEYVELGAKSWQTATWCVQPELADAASAAADAWNQAAPRVRVMVVQRDDVGVDSIPGCDQNAVVDARQAAGAVAGTVSGLTTVAPGVLSGPLVGIMTHEMGHTLLGDAWKRENPEHPEHSPNADDLMYPSGGYSHTAPSADDLSRLAP